MGLFKKNVIVEMHSVIEDQGEKEVTESKHKGSYIKKGQIEVITFTEKIKDFGETKYLITIYPDKVNLKRSGSIDMNQQFIAGQKSECFYRHPYGAFRLEVNTKSITRKQGNGTEEVHIVYDSEMDEGHTRKHHLMLTYTEEK